MRTICGYLKGIIINVAMNATKYDSECDENEGSDEEEKLIPNQFKRTKNNNSNN